MHFDSILAASTLAQAGAAAPDAAPATTAPGAPGAPPAPQPGFNPLLLALPIGVVIVMMWFTSRKDKKKREEMASKLQKGAKVTTIGGARGKVTAVTDTEVTVKFEDCSITFLRSAIQTVDEVPA
jgi:preprotein translocase YajC subunit